MLFHLHTIGQLRSSFGVKLGVQLNLGSHVNSIGFSAGTYFFDKHYQVNTTFQGNYNFTNYGNRKKYFSAKLAIGAVGTWGLLNKRSNFQINNLNYQSNANYGFGYSYIWYFDNIGTRQNSGAIALHVQDFSFRMENDFLAGQGRDRFHTGSVYFSYTDSLFSIGSGFDLWTGETRKSNWNREKKEKMPNGFRNLSKLPFGKTSHGIWFTRINVNLPYQQNIALKVGWDSENIRHVVQNRIMHDLIFLPKKIERKTPHYPRIDNYGNPCFIRDSIKQPSIYYQIGLNTSWEN